jgi:multidrug efflux system membrane fusion protein
MRFPSRFARENQTFTPDSVIFDMSTVARHHPACASLQRHADIRDRERREQRRSRRRPFGLQTPRTKKGWNVIDLAPRRPCFAIPLLAVLFGSLLAACSDDTTHAPPPPKVDVLQPVAREVLDWDEYTARLEAVESVEVRPRVSGYLEAVNFEDGAMVKKGDCLFEIDPRPYQATLRHAEADLAANIARLGLAEKNLARSADLIRTHAISQEDADVRASNVEQARAAVLQSRAAVDAAKLDVEFTRLAAPISGRIGRRLVTEGNLVTGGLGTQGTLLTTIVQLDPLYAYFEADERSYLKYMHLAQSGERPTSREFHHPVWIGVADEEGFPREGLMDFVDNQLDRGTGTMVGRALVSNPDLLLSPGLFARLRLPGSGQYGAVVVPDEAIGNDQAKKFVWVIDAENKAQLRNVETGPLLDGARVIREGLTRQDWVVVAGMQRVRAGDVVDPQRVDNAHLAPKDAPAAPVAPPRNAAAADRAAPSASTPANAPPAAATSPRDPAPAASNPAARPDVDPPQR